MQDGGVRGKYYIDYSTNTVYVVSAIKRPSGGVLCVYGRAYNLNGLPVCTEELNIKGLDKCFGDSQTSENILLKIYEKNPEIAPQWFKNEKAQLLLQPLRA